eukprot:CAMPEP_0167824190 /NCGR_PEP_ID=MMETSP0112_2-20121227/8633_1 /TAXON_ID=91324 /ORGANISM="Lotharella globosa, Strain CCCM811" /LENGTH=80 /DNA_ID=CAMNT_0007726079 /DNA_START=106 /DNA_END=345 /DNA_ORIENTATION=+
MALPKHIFAKFVCVYIGVCLSSTASPSRPCWSSRETYARSRLMPSGSAVKELVRYIMLHVHRRGSGSSSSGSGSSGSSGS